MSILLKSLINQHFLCCCSYENLLKAGYYWLDDELSVYSVFIWQHVSSECSLSFSPSLMLPSSSAPIVLFPCSLSCWGAPEHQEICIFELKRALILCSYVFYLAVLTLHSVSCPWYFFWSPNRLFWCFGIWLRYAYVAVSTICSVASFAAKSIQSDCLC